MMTGPRKCLYNVWDEVETHWRLIRRTLHPDMPGGDSDRFAYLCGIYTEIERRMKVKGILACIAMLLFTGCHIANPDGNKHFPDIPDSWRYQGEPDARLDRLPEARMFSTVRAAALVTPANSVSLIFDPSPDSTVTGYAIYYWSGQVTNTVDLGLELTGRIDDLVPGVTNHFAAVAYNQLGQQSKFSNVVQYTVPDFSNRSVTIVLLSAPSAVGPWTARLTNTIPASSGMEVFVQSIKFD